jgi:hypothetical protein
MYPTRERPDLLTTPDTSDPRITRALAPERNPLLVHRMRRPVLLAICCLLTAWVVGPAPADAATPVRLDRSAPWLAFVSDHGGPPNAISTLARSGDVRSDEPYLCDLSDVARVEQPGWSPDGSMLSFVQQVVTSDVGCEDSLQVEYRLVVMEAEEVPVLDLLVAAPIGARRRAPRGRSGK